MTATDTLVRELADRAERAAPPMSLDPAVVLHAARRRHRRATRVRGTTGALAALAVGAAVLQLAPDETPATAAALVLDGTLSVQLGRDAGLVPSPDGNVVDTGVPYPAGRADGRYLVAGDEHRVRILAGTVDGVDDHAHTVLDTLVARAHAGRLPLWLDLEAHHVAVLGAVPAGAAGTQVDLLVAGERHPVPIFDVPGSTADVWFVRLQDAVRSVDDWPAATVVVRTPDGAVDAVQLTDLARQDVAIRAADESDPVGPVRSTGYLPPGDVRPDVHQATSTRATRADGRTVLDLDIPADGAGATYAVELVPLAELRPDDLLTDEEAAALEGLRLLRVQPDGTSEVLRDADLLAAAALPVPTIGGWFETSDGVGMLGMLREGESGRLLLNDGDAIETPALETFALPGRDERFFLVTFGHEEPREEWVWAGLQLDTAELGRLTNYGSLVDAG